MGNLSVLFGAGMLAVKSSKHRFQLLFDELMLLFSDQAFLSVDMENLAVLCSFSIDYGKALLNIILIDLNLTEVNVDYLHRVFTSWGVIHDMIPVL